MRVPGLRDERERRLLTQAELAERSGVSRVTIVRIEGGTDARIPTIKRLADALGSAPETLIGRTNGAQAR